MLRGDVNLLTERLSQHQPFKISIRQIKIYSLYHKFEGGTEKVKFEEWAENGDEHAIKVLASEQREQQQEEEFNRQFDEYWQRKQSRRQFVDDVNNLRKRRKLYY